MPDIDTQIRELAHAADRGSGCYIDVMDSKTIIIDGVLTVDEIERLAALLKEKFKNV